MRWQGFLPFLGEATRSWEAFQITNLGNVENGFTRQIPLNELAGREQYDPEMLSQNLLFGSPNEIIEKLKLYEKLGVDEFIYYASMGLGQEEQKKSLKLFIDEVMPEFAQYFFT